MAVKASRTIVTFRDLLAVKRTNFKPHSPRQLCSRWILSVGALAHQVREGVFDELVLIHINPVRAQSAGNTVSTRQAMSLRQAT